MAKIRLDVGEPGTDNWWDEPSTIRQALEQPEGFSDAGLARCADAIVQYVADELCGGIAYAEGAIAYVLSRHGMIGYMAMEPREEVSEAA